MKRRWKDEIQRFAESDVGTPVVVLDENQEDKILEVSSCRWLEDLPRNKTYIVKDEQYELRKQLFFEGPKFLQKFVDGAWGHPIVSYSYRDITKDHRFRIPRRRVIHFDERLKKEFVSALYYESEEHFEKTNGRENIFLHFFDEVTEVFSEQELHFLVKDNERRCIKDKGRVIYLDLTSNKIDITIGKYTEENFKELFKGKVILRFL